MDVVGEVGQHHHVVGAFQLSRVGTGVTGRAVTAIDEGGSTIVNHFGDGCLPADERLGTAAGVTLEVLKPRVVGRDGDGTASRVEMSRRREQRRVTAAQPTHLHVVGGAAAQSGERVRGVGGGVVTRHRAAQIDGIFAGVAAPGNGGTIELLVADRKVARREALGALHQDVDTGIVVVRVGACGESYRYGTAVCQVHCLGTGEGA